jgi:transcriptional regulator with XRE-family HTH domain
MSDLARRADLTYVTISRIERGIHEPQYRTQHRLANALGVRVDVLFPLPATPLRGSDAAMQQHRATAA